MATRDKTREATIAGCRCEPMPAVGLGNIKNDNGTALRTAKVKQAIIGLAGTSTDVRTYSPIDKPLVERLFRLLEEMILNNLPGYTGGKPGAIPGYDANKSGVLDEEELYAEITRFFVDEYPYLPHYGMELAGRRPIDVYHYVEQNRGVFKPLDADDRRIQQGLKFEVTPSKMGVKVCGGMTFTSGELLKLKEFRRTGSKKVEVFLDPGNLREVTVIIPGNPKKFRATNTFTAFHQLTLAEFTDVMESYRRNNPADLQLHNDRIAASREARRKKMKETEKKFGVVSSSMSLEKLRQQADDIMGGADLVPTTSNRPTAEPGSLTDGGSRPGLLPIGQQSVIDHDDSSASKAMLDDEIASPSKPSETLAPEKKTTNFVHSKKKEK
jgi:hypothetical protein